MISDGLAVEAVVPFLTTASLEIDSTPYRILLCGSTDERATALLRLSRRLASETDVVDATGEIMTRVALVFSRWELRQRHDDALVAEADVSPTGVRPFAPFPCVVRLFGDGTTAGL